MSLDSSYAGAQTVRNGPRAGRGDCLTPTQSARSRLRTPLLAAAGVTLFAVVTLLALIQSTAGRADPAIDCYENEFLGLLNQYRIQNGRQPLALNSQLSAAADWMSGDLGRNAYFSHIDSLGRDPGQRARDYGYTGGVGENIAAGVSLGSAQAAFDAWKNSSGHNENMLGSTYQVIGIGRVYVPGSPYGLYWTTDFGEAANAAGAVAPVISCGSTPPPAAETNVVGDVNCDSQVGSADALSVLRLVAGLAFQPACSAVADVDCDGRITSTDALDILAYVAGIPHRQKASCPSIGSST